MRRAPPSFGQISDRGLPRRREELEFSSMSWSAIVNAFRRLDDRLSDAVYLHGRCLTGQEKIVRGHRAEATGKSLNLQSWAPGLMRIAHRHDARGSMR
jgi:hypothetical protein